MFMKIRAAKCQGQYTEFQQFFKGHTKTGRPCILHKPAYFTLTLRLSFQFSNGPPQ